MSPIAVSAKLYGQVFLKAFNKEINWASDTIKAMVCTSSYVPDQDAHVYKSSVTGEVSGTGYTAGGLVLTSKTIAYSAASNTVTLDAADLGWSGASFTGRYVVIYDAATGADATSPLICYIDFGVDVTASGGNFTVTFDAAGICTLTAA